MLRGGKYTLLQIVLFYSCVHDCVSCILFFKKFSAEKCAIFKFRDETLHIRYEQFILDDIDEIEIGKYYNIRWTKGPVLPPKKMQLQSESILYDALAYIAGTQV